MGFVAVAITGKGESLGQEIGHWAEVEGGDLCLKGFGVPHYVQRR